MLLGLWFDVGYYCLRVVVLLSCVDVFVLMFDCIGLLVRFCWLLTALWLFGCVLLRFGVSVVCACSWLVCRWLRLVRRDSVWFGWLRRGWDVLLLV